MDSSTGLLDLPTDVLYQLLLQLRQPQDPPRQARDWITLAGTCTQLRTFLFTQSDGHTLAPIDHLFAALSGYRGNDVEALNRSAYMLYSASDVGGLLAEACERDRPRSFEAALGMPAALFNSPMSYKACLFHRHWLPAKADPLAIVELARMCYCYPNPASVILIQPHLIDPVLDWLENVNYPGLDTLCSQFYEKLLHKTPDHDPYFFHAYEYRDHMDTAAELDCLIKLSPNVRPHLTVDHDKTTPAEYALTDKIDPSRLHLEVARVRFAQQPVLKTAVRIACHVANVPYLRLLADNFFSRVKHTNGHMTRFFVDLCKQHPIFWHQAAVPALIHLLDSCDLGSQTEDPQTGQPCPQVRALLSMIPRRMPLSESATLTDLVEAITQPSEAAQKASDAAFWILVVFLYFKKRLNLMQHVCRQYTNTHTAQLIMSNLRGTVWVARSAGPSPTPRQCPHQAFLISLGYTCSKHGGDRFLPSDALEDKYDAIIAHVLAWVLRPVEQF